ncbi:hypothetical protein AeMF1_019365 [Aphanomyces euteiches]|nr:hypothetical protein AeMF1_019365 [Aphanomyces euteiches]
MSVEGELPRARVWKRGRASIKEGLSAADTSSKIKGNSGRKCTRSPAAIEEAIKAVSHLNRQTLRTLAVKASIPKTTILRHMKQNPRLKARSNYVKPMLTEDNKLERLKFAMSFLRPSSSGSHFFDNMYNYVHVDEKWFYLTKVRKKFYVYDDEDIAVRSVKSKGFITKVMFSLLWRGQDTTTMNEECLMASLEFGRSLRVFLQRGRAKIVLKEQSRPYLSL